jgi:hypothetical protein
MGTFRTKNVVMGAILAGFKRSSKVQAFRAGKKKPRTNRGKPAREEKIEPRGWGEEAYNHRSSIAACNGVKRM